jgi:hypothetical protein
MCSVAFGRQLDLVFFPARPMPFPIDQEGTEAATRVQCGQQHPHTQVRITRTTLASHHPPSCARGCVHAGAYVPCAHTCQQLPILLY